MKFTIPLFLVTVLLSCNNSTLESIKDNSSQISNASENEEEDNKFPFKIEKFIFDKAIDEINSPNSGYFQLVIEFTNNTTNKIIDGELKKYLELSYKNQQRPFKLGGEYQGRYLGLPYQINKDKPWLPNTKRKFIIYFGLPISDFEKTPSSAYLKIGYKFNSIDDEYSSKEFKYDILKEWKDFQTRQGIR